LIRIERFLSILSHGLVSFIFHSGKAARILLYESLDRMFDKRCEIDSEHFVETDVSRFSFGKREERSFPEFEPEIAYR